MSDTATRDDSSTIADYETSVEGSADDERWELIRGRIFSMTDPTEAHDQIVGGIFARLRIAMEPTGCQV